MQCPSRRERRRIAPDGVRPSGRNPGKAPPSRPRPVGPRRIAAPTIMRPASRRCALKGHDFSRAANAPQRSSASAAAGCLPRFLSPQKISSMGTPCVRIGLQSYRKTPLKRVGLQPLRDVVSESAQARFGRDAAGSGRGRAPGTTPPASSERSRSNRKVQRSGVGTNYRNNSNTSEGVIEICAHPRWWENEDKNKDGLPAGETGCLVIPSMEAVWDRILCKSRTYLGCS